MRSTTLRSAGARTTRRHASSCASAATSNAADGDAADLRLRPGLAAGNDRLARLTLSPTAGRSARRRDGPRRPAFARRHRPGGARRSPRRQGARARARPRTGAHRCAGARTRTGRVESALRIRCSRTRRSAPAARIRAGNVSASSSSCSLTCRNSASLRPMRRARSEPVNCGRGHVVQRGEHRQGVSFCSRTSRATSWTRRREQRAARRSTANA